MKVGKNLFKNLRIDLLIVTISLTLFGLVEIYSATSTYHTLYYFKKQLIWGILSIFGMIFFALFDYKHLKDYAIPLYILNLLLLILVLVIGKKVMGAKRWIAIGPLNFQPSELLKITSIILIAKYFSDIKQENNFSLFNILDLIALLIIPIGLVIIQPDLGTGLLVLLVSGSMILFSGIKKSSIFKIIVGGCLSIPFLWHFLKDYQKKRILTFIFPERDPLGAGYHILQSKIAIGSGRILGKGFLKGTQNKLAFLPEHHTDFIFSVLGEEFGFVGCMILLLLFFLFLLICIDIAKNAKDSFGTLLVIGIMFLFFWQIFINVGMVMGILPVVGIPLPFISYGGTSLFVSYCLVGIMLNVSLRRYFF